MEVLSDTVKSWLLDTGSLTDRIIASASSHFTLSVIGEGQVSLHPAEQQVLGQSAFTCANREMTVREVLLQDSQTPWVFARSVIPNALMQGALSQLGSEPLGKRLFNDNRFSRGHFELCRVSHPTFAGDSGLTLWGRRSCFHYQQHRLLVAELFLPAAPIYQTDN